jgi:hypothetical protein
VYRLASNFRWEYTRDERSLWLFHEAKNYFVILSHFSSAYRWSQSTSSKSSGKQANSDWGESSVIHPLPL